MRSQISYLFNLASDINLGKPIIHNGKYNHPIYENKAYHDDIKRTSHQKIVNNEIASDEAISFDKEFKSFTSMDNFHYYHYACTGALAIEAAIKTALDFQTLLFT